MFSPGEKARDDDEPSITQSSEPLLVDNDDQVAQNQFRREYEGEHGRWRRALLIHGLIISLYTVAYLVLIILTIPSSKNALTQQHLPLPAREGLIWEKRKFPTKIVDNPFSGEPRPELDEAWHRLLRNDNIRVPKDYLDEKNLTSVYTKDGSEGVASLSVYHSLHCLKKVKKMLFKEHYHQNKSSEAMAREAKHVDHCVEYIREALMCQPDLSMVTFRWINNTAQHEDKSAFWPTNFDVDMHTCANWQALDAWAGERMFDLFQVDKLQRPSPG